MELFFSDKMDNPTVDKLPCFFCLQDSRKFSNSFESYFWGSVETSFSEFSLRNLYRFLNLLKYEEEEKNMKDLKMPICEKCNKLTSEFNKLYNLLEETKLRLDWCVQKMKVVMEKTRKPITLEACEDDGSMMRILRTDTMNRINSITQLPRVAVHKMKREQENSFASQNLQKKVKRKHAKLVKEDMNLKIIDTIGNAMDMTTPFPIRPPPSLLSQNQHDYEMEGKEADAANLYPPELSPETELGIKVECNVEITEEPPDELNITITDENPILGRHIKLENGISTAFQDDLPTFQYDDTQEIGKLKSPPKVKGAYMSNFAPITFSNTDTVRCLLCSKTLSRNRAYAHWNYYCLKGMRRPIISKTRSDHSSKCSYCPFVCTGGIAGMGSSMSKHQVRFHPEHYFLEEREKASGLNLEQFQKVLVDFLFPDFILTREGNLMSCSLCRKEYGSQNKKDNRVLVQKHLIFNHKTELKERLNTILGDPFLEEGLHSNSHSHGNQPIPEAASEIIPPNDMEIDFEDTTEIEKEEIGEIDSSSKCTYCSYICGATGASAIGKTMAKHNVRFHPEHFFPEEWGSLQGTGYRLEEFQGILRNKLFPELLSQTGQGAGQVVTCSICDKKYTGRCGTLVMMQKHLIHKHKSKVKKRLKTILQDPMDMDGGSGNPSTKKSKHLGKNRKQTNCVAPTPTASSKLSSSCPYCRYKCGVARGRSVRESIEKHLVRYHPAHFLLDDRDDMDMSIEFDSWNEQIRQIFHQEIFPKIVSTNGPHATCSLCGLKYKNRVSSNNAIMTKRHVMLQHKSYVKEQVNILLKDSYSEEIPIEKVGESLENSSCQDQDQDPLEYNPVSDEEEEEEETQPKSNSSSVKFMSHFTPLSSDETKVCCKLCMKSLDRKNASTHWNYYCVKGLRRPIALQGHEGSGNNRISKCPYCPFKCGGRGFGTSMSRHQIRYHPEHYFPELKEKALTAPGLNLNLEEFQKILVHILFPEFISKKGGLTSCTLCKMRYKSKFGVRANAQRHLVFMHKMELTERLEAILELEDGMLKKRLEILSNEPAQFRTRANIFKRKGKSSSTSMRKCPHCTFECGENTKAKWTSIVKHQVRFHPEQYFPEEREKASELNLNLEQFQKVLVDILFPEYMKKMGCNIMSCCLCGMNYAGKILVGNRLLLQRHLIYKHRTLLREKLKIILQDPLLERRLGSCKGKKSKRSWTATTMKKQKQPVPIPDATKHLTNCPYCPFKCNAVHNGVRRNSMVSHLIRYHPEHFLVDEGNGDLSGLENGKLRRILNDIIFPKFVLSSGNHTSCSLCGVKYGKSDHLSNNTVMAKRHVLFHHKTKVKEEIKIILEDPLLEERLQNCKPEEKPPVKKPVKTVPPKPKAKYSSNCPYCRFKCGTLNNKSTKDSIIKHLVRFHPEHFLKKEEGFILERGQIREILMKNIFPNFIVNKGRFPSCSLCGVKYKATSLSNNTVMARKHILFVHKNEVKKEFKKVVQEQDTLLEEIVDNGNGESKVKAVVKSSQIRQKKDDKTALIPRSLTQCPYCRFKCGSRNPRTSMLRHLARFHPEHFLKEDEESNEIPIPGLRHPQFQRILTDIVFPEFITIRSGHQTKCSLCEKKFVCAKLYENMIFARKHVMCLHKVEMKERLSVVMEDPKLDERLDSCNTNGVTCSCGIYFPQSEVSTQTYHEKFHCSSMSIVTEKVEEENVPRTGGVIEEEECLMEVNDIHVTDSNECDVDPLG